MNLAESISYTLNGKRSGKGFRIPTVCHGGDGFNLQISDAPDGKLKATCFSHGCSYKEIMESLESLSLKPKTEFTSNQCKSYIQKINKHRYREALFIEAHILLQFLNSRDCDKTKSSDSNYLKLHPEFVPMPEEPFEREIKAAKRTIKLIGKVYGL